MVAEHDVSSIAFSGTRKIQGLASKAFTLMRAQGMFMSGNAPIFVTLDSLTTYLVENEGAKPADVTTALSENAAVFTVETRDGVDVVVTTRDGHPPRTAEPGMSHSLHERFLTPEPKPVRPPRPVRKRVKVDPNWATFSVPDYVDEEEEAEIESVTAAAAAQAPPEPAPEPRLLDEPVQVIVEPVVPVDTPAAATPPADEPAPADVPTAATEIDTVPVPGAQETPDTADVPEAVTVEPETLDAEPQPVAPVEEVATTAPEIVEPLVAAAQQIVVPVVEERAPAPKPAEPSIPAIDLTGIEDAAIADAIETQLGADLRAARFAGQWMVEERVPRLSRGDLRRTREYIQEQEQPLTDATLVQDILNVRPNSAEFSLMQFAVNFRLSREHREFDFVGTNDQRFWSTSNLPQIGTTRRKPNDVGTDYRFLTEEAGDVAYRSVAAVDHVLTFYEHSLGLLPYDNDLRALLPKPVLEDQRSAVLTFEIPQSYTTYLVELRYPTPNRGGFLLGLDDFYAESLVPGAMLSIGATENDGHYTVEFLAAKDQNARLLELDDRRSPRYLFRPTTYTCEVAPDWLISEDRFPRLGSEKPLDDRTRRRPEAVVAATFERIGIEDGGAYSATFDDLLAAVNIERPFSGTLLRAALDGDSRVSDDGSDTYTYAAGS